MYRKPHTTAQLPWSTDFNVTHRIHVYYCFVTSTFGDLISLEPTQLPAFSTGVTLYFGLKWRHTGWFLSMKKNLQYANIFLLENVFIFTVSQFSAVKFLSLTFQVSLRHSENSLQMLCCWYASLQFLVAGDYLTKPVSIPSWDRRKVHSVSGAHLDPEHRQFRDRTATGPGRWLLTSIHWIFIASSPWGL